MSESSAEFAARLRRTLQGAAKPSAGALEASPPATAAPTARTALPDWYLRRGAIAQAAKLSPTAPGAAQSRTRGMPRDIATALNSRGEYGERIEHFPADFVHGFGRLGEVDHARGAALALLTADPKLAAFDPRDCTFLDIETTGLSGGAGTQVFQIGLMHFDGRVFELWQGFLRSPAEAPALLEACAQRVRQRGCLVSFFGKSFDRHRLEDQMRLHHVDPPFEQRAHLDLYHLCRRLYGAAFVDGRLATMERELCGVQREHDLPGSFAPAAWFDFLAGREHLLEAVFLHNRIDVLSLAALCAHVSRVLDADETAQSALGGPRDARALALCEWFTRRRDWPRVLQWSELALAAAAQPRAVLACRARALERSGRNSEARAAFSQVAQGGSDGLSAQALAELARLAWRDKDFDATNEACQRAEQLAANTLTGARLARLSLRVASLRARLAKAGARAESRADEQA
jgi:uncharacterized protein YprB with RNaseH-like and TPR domain